MRRLVLVLGTSCLAATACDPTFESNRDNSPDPVVGGSATPKDEGRALRPAVEVAAYTSGFDLCDPSVFTCLDDQAIEFCGLDGWVQADCAVICGAAGFSGSWGCGYEDSLGGDACFCDGGNDPGPYPTPDPEPSPSCSYGWSCSGGDLAFCDGSSVERWDCDAVCRDSGFDFATACAYDSSSQDETCWCDSYDAGPTCSLSGATCSGANTIDACDAYGETTYDCNALCQDLGYDFSEGCSYDSGSGEDACFCNYGGATATCYSDEMMCGDGTCLHESYICDGIADCPGADDEYGCPAACSEADIYCIDAYTISSCGYDGQPQATDCDVVCQDAGYSWSEGCSYDASYGGDACFCQ